MRENWLERISVEYSTDIERWVELERPEVITIEDGVGWIECWGEVVYDSHLVEVVDREQDEFVITVSSRLANKLNENSESNWLMDGNKRIFYNIEYYQNLCTVEYDYRG